jgi:hypothetical protein
VALQWKYFPGFFQVRRGRRVGTLISQSEGVELKTDAHCECFVVRERVTARLGGRRHSGTYNTHKHFRKAARVIRIMSFRNTMSKRTHVAVLAGISAHVMSGL